MNELALAIPWLGRRNPAAARRLVLVLALAAPATDPLTQSVLAAAKLTACSSMRCCSSSTSRM